MPVTTSGATVNRFCSSGLQTIAMAAHRVLVDRVPVMVAGGVESISCVQATLNQNYFQDEWLAKNKPELYWNMLQTAEYVSKKYDISREVQDRYGVLSQQRAAKSRAEGKFKDEIVPITTKMKVVDKATGTETLKEVTAEHDEGIRADTTYEGVSQIKPAIEGGVIAAGNASQFSDGASAQVIMSDKEAARRGLKPMGVFRGFAVAGCEPKEMGIGPVFAVPKLLAKAGLKVSDIDLWELNEAFAVQALAVAREVGLNMDTLNVNGGAIALGHPIGCTGARILVTLVHEMQRRDVKRGLATLCVSGGMGMAMALER